MARSDRHRRVPFVVAFFAGALGLGVAGACSAVPDVTYEQPEASATDAPRTDGPNPVDTGVKDTGAETSACGAAICCGATACMDCVSLSDCAACAGDGGGCPPGQVCCRKGANVTCRSNC